MFLPNLACSLLAPQVAGAAALWGNRLAARGAGDGCLLAAHPEGRAGERLVLSELRAGADGRWQARVLGSRPHCVPSLPLQPRPGTSAQLPPVQEHRSF